MKKILWTLCISLIPLLILRYFRPGDIPLTHYILLPLMILDHQAIIRFYNLRSNSLLRKMTVILMFFVLLFFVDLVRELDFQLGFSFVVKTLILVITLIGYSFYIHTYTLNYFLKVFLYSGTFILFCCVFRSFFLLHAPYFVVDPTLITEEGKNQIAFYLAVTFPIIVCSRFLTTPRVNTFAWAFGLFVFLFSIVYVQSRGLIVTVVFTLLFSIFYFFSSGKAKFGSRLLVIIASVILLMGVLYTVTNVLDLSKFTNKFSNTFDSTGENTSELRQELLLKSLDYFYNNPIIGIGTNNFFSITTRASHNNYSQILAENGVVGFIPFVIFFYIILTSLKDYRYRFTYLVWFALLLTISFIVYFSFINAFFTAITFAILSIIVAARLEMVSSTKYIQQK